MSILRSYARNIAKKRFKKAGLTQICKQKFDGHKYPSYFSTHWREAFNK